jgi:hypothetical protein
MRPVEFYKYVRDDNTKKYDLVKEGEAKFHQFGCNYEEFESGAGNYTTAVIELEDGSIKNIPVELIKFLDAKVC